MNPNLDQLAPYPFERLRALVQDIEPNPALTPLSLGIGEPQHAPPQAVLDALVENLPLAAKYPATLGSPELRRTLAEWLTGRFGLQGIDPDSQIIPVNGTREALFAMVQAWVQGGTVAMPNPFYQIYEGAAKMASAGCLFLPETSANGYKITPNDLGDAKPSLVFLCSPGNPSGSVMTSEDYGAWIDAAQARDFILVADECYSELYRNEDTPPTGLLQAAAARGQHDFRNLIAVGSLSKRSNLPGLRSGYVAGDAQLLKAFARYRTYHGCAMPGHHQAASQAAWQDEHHVQNNRRLYNEKYARAQAILGPYLSAVPEAGFYLWLPVPGGDDEGLTRHLLHAYNLRVLAGRYLGREIDGVNPGAGYIRCALVSAPDTTEDALKRLRRGLDDWSAQ